jgi:hypothetical protein
MPPPGQGFTIRGWPGRRGNEAPGRVSASGWEAPLGRQDISNRATHDLKATSESHGLSQPLVEPLPRKAVDPGVSFRNGRATLLDHDISLFDKAE